MLMILVDQANFRCLTSVPPPLRTVCPFASWPFPIPVCPFARSELPFLSTFTTDFFFEYAWAKTRDDWTSRWMETNCVTDLLNNIWEWRIEICRMIFEKNDRLWLAGQEPMHMWNCCPGALNSVYICEGVLSLLHLKSQFIRNLNISIATLAVLQVAPLLPNMIRQQLFLVTLSKLV